LHSFSGAQKSNVWLVKRWHNTPISHREGPLRGSSSSSTTKLLEEEEEEESRWLEAVSSGPKCCDSEGKEQYLSIPTAKKTHTKKERVHK
jgi:hypothetical protein